MFFVFLKFDVFMAQEISLMNLLKDDFIEINLSWTSCWKWNKLLGKKEEYSLTSHYGQFVWSQKCHRTFPTSIIRTSRTFSTRLHAKRNKFENNRRFRSKSAGNMCSCLLLAGSTKTHRNCTIITPSLTNTSPLRSVMNRKRAELRRDLNI